MLLALRSTRLRFDDQEIVVTDEVTTAIELIIPDFNGYLTRAKDTCDLFMQQVAPAFR